MPEPEIRKQLQVNSRQIRQTSLDELPPDVRQRLIEALQRGEDRIELPATTEIRVKGADGVEHVYHSADEAPPEIRALLRRAGEAKPRGASSPRAGSQAVSEIHRLESDISSPAERITTPDRTARGLKALIVVLLIAILYVLVKIASRSG